MMNIRRAEKRDIQRLIDLLHQVLEVHADLRPDIFIPGTTKYSPQELERMLENENTPIFAAETDGQVIGYAMCEVLPAPSSGNMHSNTCMYIDDLCVDRAFRSRHAGKALYEAVCDYAREIGCYHVTLNVWTGNDSALRFYEAMGMRPMKTCMEQIL